MNERNTSALFGLALLLALGGVVGYRLYHRGERQPPHAVTVWDRSLSTKDGCASVVGIESTVLSSPTMEKGSTMTLLATGDPSTANEPMFLLRHDVPKVKKAMEGRDVGERRREVLLQETMERCRATPASNFSPIVVAVKRGAEQLRSLGCRGDTSACQLFVVSDGEEEGDPVVTAVLGGKEKKLSAPFVDNDGIAVTLCGLTDTVASQPKKGRARSRASTPALRDAARVDRLTTVWLSAFSRPDLVTIAPVCPKATLAAVPSGAPANIN